MDDKQKHRLEEALEASKSKGNLHLTEALYKALEEAQRKDNEPYAA
tara:strand:- start:255 stop:392 length:138 start_codon:yes stop_codon:yes gene_type:complete